MLMSLTTTKHHPSCRLSGRAGNFKGYMKTRLYREWIKLYTPAIKCYIGLVVWKARVSSNIVCYIDASFRITFSLETSSTLFLIGRRGSVIRLQVRHQPRYMCMHGVYIPSIKIFGQRISVMQSSYMAIHEIGFLKIGRISYAYVTRTKSVIMMRYG